MPNLASSEILRSVQHKVNEIYQATIQNCAMSAVANVVWQEPITWSEQLPYWGYVTAFSRMGLFFGTFYNNFFPRNWKLHLSITTFEVYIMMKETKTSSKSEGVL